MFFLYRNYRHGISTGFDSILKMNYGCGKNMAPIQLYGNTSKLYSFYKGYNADICGDFMLSCKEIKDIFGGFVGKFPDCGLTDVTNVCGKSSFYILYENGMYMFVFTIIGAGCREYFRFNIFKYIYDGKPVCNQVGYKRADMKFDFKAVGREIALKLKFSKYLGINLNRRDLCDLDVVLE